MNHYLNLSLLAATCIASNSKATMIDPFIVDPSQNISFGEKTFVNRSFVGVQRGTAIPGGERDVELFQRDRTFFQPPLFVARFENYNRYNRSYFRFGGLGPGAGNGAADGYAKLQWDGIGDEEGNLGIDRTLRNAGTGIPMFNAADGGIRIWTAGSDGGSGPPGTEYRVVLRHLGQILASETRTVIASREFKATTFEFEPDVFGIADSFSLEIPQVFASGDGEEALFISHIDTVLPEPGTYAAFAAGLGLLGLRARRKRAA